jgi:hypothetical protein
VVERAHDCSIASEKNSRVLRLEGIEAAVGSTLYFAGRWPWKVAGIKPGALKSSEQKV